MSNRKYIKQEPTYRPAMGQPYRRVFELIAKEINKTSMETFDDLDAARHCAFEMWKRMFPGVPFPKDADVLRRRYDMDPNIRESKSKSVQSV